MQKISYPRSIVLRRHNKIHIEDSLPIISVFLTVIWLALLWLLVGRDEFALSSIRLKLLLAIFWLIGFAMFTTTAFRRRLLVIDLADGKFRFSKFWFQKDHSVSGRSSNLIGPELVRDDYDETKRELLLISIPDRAQESFVLASSRDGTSLMAAKEKWDRILKPGDSRGR